MPEPLDHTRRDRWSAEPDTLPARAFAALAARWDRTPTTLTTPATPGPAPEPAPKPATSPLVAGSADAGTAISGLVAGSADAGTAISGLVAEADSGDAGTAVLEALFAVVGVEQVHTGSAARDGRAGGLSYLDLLRRRLGAAIPVPDLVVTPADHDEVQAVLTVCREHGVAVVPFGGGTSVVGGVAALGGGRSTVLVLDLCRLDRLVHLDPVSRLAVLQAGVRGPDAERLLGAHGLTLGHLPQSFERATIGGFAATRSAGQASSGYGRFEAMVHAVRLATPVGEWRCGRAPASAAGPDLRQLVLGSEGAFGVITEVTLRVRPLPTHRRYHGVVLDGWRTGVDAVRTLAQHGALADVTRLSDVAETDLGLALTGGVKAALVRRYLRARGVREPCLLILGWEAGSAPELAIRRAATQRLLRPLRPVSLGAAAGTSWLHGRFAGPRQRDALMAGGVCVETLETAARWSAVPAVAEAVRAALAAALPGAVIMCHLSHAYETGASLYFTVLARRDADDPLGQWPRAKRAATDAIVAAGATITHHHAVGVDHRPWLAVELGELGVDVLRAVKATVDPTGILNPGKLL